MPAVVPLSAGVVLRPLAVSDAAALLDAYLRNREHLRPFDPVRPASFWTLDGQVERVRSLVRQHADGETYACAMFRADRLVGCATLNTIVLGPFRSAALGYWVDAAETRQGLATGAVAAMCRIADEVVGLHRLEASTVPGNAASQRVLAKTGFERIGAAPAYLHLDGRWQDAVLFQRILNDRPPGLPASSSPGR